VEALPEEAGESDVQVASGSNDPDDVVRNEAETRLYNLDSDRYRDLIDEVTGRNCDA